MKRRKWNEMESYPRLTGCGGTTTPHPQYHHKKYHKRVVIIINHRPTFQVYYWVYNIANISESLCVSTVRALNGCEAMQKTSDCNTPLATCMGKIAARSLYGQLHITVRSFTYTTQMPYPIAVRERGGDHNGEKRAKKTKNYKIYIYIHSLKVGE